MHLYTTKNAFSALTLLVGQQEGNLACKKEWWGAGVVVCLERDADLRMAQLMLLPLTVSCLSKIQIGFTFLVLAHLGSPGKRAVKRVCVCVCYITKCMVLRCARNCHALGHRGLTSSFFIPLWKRHCFPYVGLLTSVAYHHTTLHCFLLCLC